MNINVIKVITINYSSNAIFLLFVNLLVCRAAFVFKNQNCGNECSENSDGEVCQFNETSGRRVQIIFRHLEYCAISGSPGPNYSFCELRQYIQKLVLFAEIHLDYSVPLIIFIRICGLFNCFVHLEEKIMFYLNQIGIKKLFL